jgi:AhpD family alkylhydroperoxidase
MQSRMANPAVILPAAMTSIQELVKAAHGGGVDPTTMHLVHLRASQVNGCSACVVSGVDSATKAGETPERLAAVAAWRDAPFFTLAERAALALAESVTRLNDRDDPVPDSLWDEASHHFTEPQLASLVLWTAVTNLFNRLNAATRQVARAAW